MQKSTAVALSLLAFAAASSRAAEPVDVCKLFSRADAEAVIGKLTGEPEAGKPQGSLLGQCDYDGANGRLSISARPAGEFDQTVKFSTGKGQPPQPIAGASGKAFRTKYGPMVQPAGKPYFYQVLAYKGLSQDDAMAEQVAKKLK